MVHQQSQFSDGGGGFPHLPGRNSKTSYRGRGEGGGGGKSVWLYVDGIYVHIYREGEGG